MMQAGAANRNQSRFKLVEIAIVLVIMGLLLVGQQMFTGAREHRSMAGFINGSNICSALWQRVPPLRLTPLVWVWDNKLDEPLGYQADTTSQNLRTGGHISSTPPGGLGRKVDDGSATGRVFRFSAYNGGAITRVRSETCYQAAALNLSYTTPL